MLLPAASIMHSEGESMDPNLISDESLARVTVILVTFQSAHCAKSLSESLKAFPHVIVVDNASADDSIEAFTSHIPQARVISNEINLGFGAANNKGCAIAQTEFVLLLNPDCIIDTNAVKAMLSCADQYPLASTVGPQLIDRNGHFDKSYSMGAKAWGGKGPIADGPLSVKFVSGACMLIRRNAMENVRGFDEGFFLYYEDSDLCLRLCDLAGEIIVEPQAKVIHLSRGSSGGKARLKAEFLRGYHHIQSKFLFEKKHFQKEVSFIRRLRYAILAGLECVIRLLLLDRIRASRVFGRTLGSLKYVTDQMKRQKQA
jgi:N-acetylglucosaminyl-diphospho-decaprenol L-rhamnosyltransferase